jgi:hypothetical protein
MSTVTTTDRGANALMARAQALAGGLRVRVGVLDNSPKREGPGRAAQSKKARVRAKGAASAARRTLSLLEVAVVHEFGAGPVPQRSFIRATIDARRADIEAELANLARGVVGGQIEARQALDLLGAKVAGWCQSRIADGIAPALKAATIKRKGSSKPLINTGQLRSAITWRVEG